MPGSKSVAPRGTPLEPLTSVYGDRVTVDEIRRMERDGSERVMNMLLSGQNPATSGQPSPPEPVSLRSEFPDRESSRTQEMPDSPQKADSRIPDRAQNPKDIAGSRKPPLHLVPPVANILECLVLQFGAEGTRTRKGYGAFNWRDERIQLTRYAAATMRHLAAWLDGEDDDEESHLPHLAHARATLGIMLDAISLGKSLDDRPHTGAAAKTIKHYTLPDPTEIE